MSLNPYNDDDIVSFITLLNEQIREEHRIHVNKESIKVVRKEILDSLQTSPFASYEIRSFEHKNGQAQTIKFSDISVSSNMRAVLVLLGNKDLRKLLAPLMNIERDEIDWKRINYGSLSGGFQSALSWAISLFCDCLPPEDWEWRDPFSSFGVMDRDLQVLAIRALGVRYGFVEVNIKDKPLSPFQNFLKQKEEELINKMNDEEKRKKLKLVDE